MKMRAMQTSNPVVAAVFATVLLLGSVVQAQTTYTSDDFESYGVGTYTNIGDWASDTASMTITNYTYAFTPSAGFPLPGSTHEKVMVLEGNVTNDISALPSPPMQYGTNFVDLLLKPTFMSEDDEMPTIPSNTQTAVVFDHLGQLHLYSYIYTNAASFEGAPGWSMIGTNDFTAGSNAWVRVTIEADYNFDNFVSTHFRLHVDGNIVTNENSYNAPQSYDFTPGDWFVMATFGGAEVSTNEQYRLNALSLRGTGSFDDLAVTDFVPTFESFVYYEITPSVMGNGTITPSEVQYVLEGEDSAEFTFAAASGYVLTNVYTVTEGVTNNLGAVAAYTFTNVMANADIVAHFVVDSAEGQPSSAWFTATGIEPENLGNDRGDGMTYRQAWLASVDPMNTNAIFEIVASGQADGSNYVQWVSTYVDETLPPFAIWARTNLMDVTYDPVGEYPRVAADPISDPVTNTWWGDAPAYPIYYRVVATNTPPAP